MFEEAAPFLFQNIPDWEDEYDQPQIVCVEHRRFIPCRKCLYGAPASVPYSCDPADVEAVNQYQQGKY